MPVKWTPEIDQILLLKILETSDVSPKCVDIAEKWPANLERPTPRAISERIFKIRAQAKASGTANHFAVPSAASNGGTPRKKNPNSITKKTPSKKTNGSKGGEGKRKRDGHNDDESADGSEPDGFKSDNNGSDASDDETPKKKSKVNSTAKGKNKDKDLIKVEEGEEENGIFHHSGYENPYGGDGSTEVIDYA